jgi:type I restriction enzyme S subunit
MSVPALRFKEFNDEWKVQTIEDLFTFKNGLNKEKEYFGKGTPIINFKDVYKGGGLNTLNVKGLVEVNDKEALNFSCKKGDVFFTRTSETINDIGMSATLLEDIPNCVFSGFVLRARPKNDNLVDLFKVYCFSIESIRNEITSKSSYTTRALTSGTLLNKVLIKYPNSKLEQTKIANFLTAVDEKITHLTQKYDLLTQYKKGVMQQIFSQELRFKDDDGGDFPAWEEKTLGDISIKKSSNIAANKIENNSGDYKIYGAAGVLKKVDFFTQNNAYISIVKDGAGVGRVFLCEQETSVLGTMDIIEPKGNVDISFLYAVLEQIDFTIYVTGSTIPHIYFKDYSKETVGIPVIKEQEKIANFLIMIDDKITITKTELQAVKQYKQGLLQQMFV